MRTECQSFPARALKGFKGLKPYDRPSRSQSNSVSSPTWSTLPPTKTELKKHMLKQEDVISNHVPLIQAAGRFTLPTQLFVGSKGRDPTIWRTSADKTDRAGRRHENNRARNGSTSGSAYEHSNSDGSSKSSPLTAMLKDGEVMALKRNITLFVPSAAATRVGDNSSPAERRHKTEASGKQESLVGTPESSHDSGREDTNVTRNRAETGSGAISSPTTSHGISSVSSPMVRFLYKGQPQSDVPSSGLEAECRGIPHLQSEQSVKSVPANTVEEPIRSTGSEMMPRGHLSMMLANLPYDGSPVSGELSLPRLEGGIARRYSRVRDRIAEFRLIGLDDESSRDTMWLSFGKLSPGVSVGRIDIHPEGDLSRNIMRMCF